MTAQSDLKDLPAHFRFGQSWADHATTFDHLPMEHARRSVPAARSRRFARHARRA